MAIAQNTPRFPIAQKFFIVKGKRFVSDTRVGRSGTRQVFVSCEWSSDTRDANTYIESEAKEIAKKFGGTVKPVRELRNYW